MALIQVSDDIWEKLNRMKHVGETFDEIIKQLIKNQKEDKKDGKNNKGN